MKVRDLMQSPAPAVRPDAQVTDVARLILDRNLSGVAVVDGSGRVRGVVTQADLVAKHARVYAPLYLGILGGILPFDTGRTEEELRHVLAVTAAELMSEREHLIDGDAEIDDAASRMVEHRENPLLVMEGETLVGMLSQTDVIGLLLREELESGDGNQ